MIRVDAIRKRYPSSKIDVLRNVSFEVSAGEIYTLLGPSGCGKTTLLRSVAGLDVPDGGTIELNGVTMFSSERMINVPPDRRNIGMVFQSYAVWPHMTVAENVAYPLLTKKLTRAIVQQKVTHALEAVGLGDLAGRPTPSLSGGQQQRVALARAVVGEPNVLLFDEPLSNLDARLREEMRHELTRLQRSLGHTAIYVTHDQEEALTLSTRIGLMRGGEIIEEGTPREMYDRPKHPFTAAFLGMSNFIECTLTGPPPREGERVEVDTEIGRVSAIARRGESPRASLFFRPHKAALAGGSLSASPRFGESLTVTEIVFLGESFDVFASRGGTAVRVRIHDEQPPEVGTKTVVSIEPQYSVAFLPPDVFN